MGEIHENVEPASEVHTDEHKGYAGLSRSPNFKHMTINHFQEEYVGPKGETDLTLEYRSI
jgi:hypothetical protein